MTISKMKIYIISVFGLLITSSFLISTQLLLEKQDSSSFLSVTGTFLLIFLMSTPVFLIVNFLITCLIAIVTSLVNKYYNFKKLYISTLALNSFQVCLSSILILLLMKFNVNIKILVVASFIVSIVLLLLYRKSIINFAKVSKNAGNIVFLLGLVISTTYLIIGVIH